MPGDSAAPYRLGRLPRAVEQIRLLAAAARRAGSQREFLGALKDIVDWLRNAPLEWGDPQYDLRHPGGVVYHAIHHPLLHVLYAVFQQERQVVLLDLKAMPGSALDI